MEAKDHSFADDLMAAPVGVALLARMEREHRLGDEDPLWEVPHSSDPDSISRAVDSIATMSLGTLLLLALESASLVGQWSSGATGSVLWAYRLAPERRRIANAISEHFGELLHHPADLERQEWWHGENPSENYFGLPWLSTITAPPAEIHHTLPFAWDMGLPVSRWHLPVRPGVAVWNIDRPSDWVQLVGRYPSVRSVSQESWELRGPDQLGNPEVADLLSITHQHAVRVNVENRVDADWEAVAVDYQGAHLSWAGFLTTEGYISDLDGSSVTMLRDWGSESTWWFSDVFGEPTPLGAPDFPTHAVDVRSNEHRRAFDHQVLAKLLRR